VNLHEHDQPSEDHEIASPCHSAARTSEAPLRQPVRARALSFLRSADLLWLQRRAGNAAVVKLLREGTGRPWPKSMSHLVPRQREGAIAVSRAPEQTVAATSLPAKPVPSLQEARLAASQEQPYPVSDAVAEDINAERCQGDPLDRATRERMEHGLGTNLDDVRIHTDLAADRLARQVRAEAFTHDQDIFFRHDSYRPASPTGEALLAHELEHVATAQSGAGSPPVVRRFWSPLEEIAEKAKTETARELQKGAAESLARPENPATIDEIRDRVNQWAVWSVQEMELERLWGSYGARLPEMADKYRPEWELSLAKGVDPDLIPWCWVDKPKIATDVRSIAFRYLDANLKAVQAERARLGFRPGAPSGAEPSTEQALAQIELEEDAKRLDRAIRERDALSRIPVGWDVKEVVTSRRWGEEFTQTQRDIVHFSPDRRPNRAPGPSDTGMLPYDVVMRQYQDYGSAIFALAGKSPVLYGAMQAKTLGQMAGAETRTRLRPVTTGIGTMPVLEDDPRGPVQLMSDTLDDLERAIAATRNNPPVWQEFRPVINKVMTGKEKGPSGIDWSRPYYKGLVADEVGDYERAETMLDVALGILAAAGFIVADLLTAGGATPLLVAAAAGTGAAATGANVIRKFDKWDDLETAAKAATSHETAVVSEGQVDAAKIDAILEAGFALLDFAGAGKPVKEAMAFRATVGVGAEAATGRGARVAAGLAGLKDLPPRIMGMDVRAHRVFEGISELGVEKTAKAAGMDLDELLALVGADTPAGRLIAAHKELKALAVGKVGSDELCAAIKVACQGKEVTLGTGVKLAVDQVIQQGLETLGPVSVLQVAGGWKKLARALPDKGSPVAMRLNEWRNGVYRDLEEYIGTLAKEGEVPGDLIQRTGTMKDVSNDVDISFLGEHATENRERAAQFLAGRTGLSPSIFELDRLLQIGLFTDPRRIHMFDQWPQLAAKLDAMTAQAQEQLMWSSDYYKWLGKKPSVAAKIKEDMEALGIPLMSSAPNIGGLGKQVLARDMDKLHAQVEAIRKSAPNPPEPPADLLKQMADKQALINIHEEGGYFSSGGVRRLVSEKEAFPGYKEGKAPPWMPMMTYTGAVDQMLKYRTELEKFKEAVTLEVRVPGAHHDPVAIASAIRDMGKYGDRFMQFGKTVGDEVTVAGVEIKKLADEFQTLTEAARAETFAADVATRMDDIVGEVSDLAEKFDKAYLGLLDELKQMNLEKLRGMLGEPSMTSLYADFDVASAIVSVARDHYRFQAFKTTLVHEMTLAARTGVEAGS
jgi:hypothetical protein